METISETLREACRDHGQSEKTKSPEVLPVPVDCTSQSFLKVN